jgi:hypothetical protein
LALNDPGEEMFAKPVTLPRFNLPPLDDAEDRKQLAAKLAQERIVRAGAEAWAEISKLGSFEAWCKIGKALAIGRDYALRATGANAPTGRRYTWTFSAWCKRHGFGGMKPATRSWCLALHENLAAITAWRDSLAPGRGRRRPLNPQSCVKGWQRSLANGNGRNSKRDALFHWRRFLSCVQALPAPDQTAMWVMVSQARVADVAAA